MLRGERLTKSFGGLRAVSSLDFKIQKGEIVGLIGPNGSGKTTLFNLISGFYRPDEGCLFFKGKEITGKPPYAIAQMGIGRTFQIVRPLPDFTLLENVRIAVLYGRHGIRNVTEATGKAEEILEVSGLAEKMHQYPLNLALEDRKRLEIARALAINPELLLLDEVFAGLNEKEIEKAVAFTFEIKRRFNLTIFMVEHVMKAIMGACNRIIVLHHGAKIAEGAPDEIAHHPEVVTAYLGKDYVARL